MLAKAVKANQSLGLCLGVEAIAVRRKGGIGM